MDTIASYPDPARPRRKFIATELASEYRERRAYEEQERAELRRAHMAELCSDLNCAGKRIRAWEKLHGLRLPSVSGHPVLQAIAAATQLTLADVQNEQRLRRTRIPSNPVSAATHGSEAA